MAFEKLTRLCALAVFSTAGVISAIAAESQSVPTETYIEPLQRAKYMDTGSLIDPYQDLSDYEPTTLTLGTDKWNVIYWKTIYNPQPVKDHNGYRLHRITKDRNGNEVDNVVWDTPGSAFVIADMPGSQDRFYGVFSTGFDTFDYILKNPKSKWNKETIVRPVYGTVVKPDGTQEEYYMRSEAEMAKAAIKKPAGTYWLEGAPFGQGTLLNFLANGTGTMTVYGNRSNVSIIGELAGTRSKNKRTGKWGRRGAEMTGGYRIYIDPRGSQSFKWTMDEEGKLTITPTGKATATVTGGISDHQDVEQYYENESERRFHEQQLKSDYRTNEHVQKENRIAKEAFADRMAEIKEITLYPKAITRTDMLAITSAGSVKYMPSKKPAADDKYSSAIYSKGKSLASAYMAKRECGIDTYYDYLVKRIKSALHRDPSLFGTSPLYRLTDIDPLERTAKITFITSGNYYSGVMTFDKEYKLDMAAFKKSLVDLNEIPALQKKVEELNTAIMAYKNDKQRKKTVKEYEKRYKNDRPTADTFYGANNYLKVVNTYNDFIKYQQEALDFLKD